MKPLELISNKAVWNVDALKGSSNRNNYDEIKYIEENHTDQISINLKNKNLQNLLKHAVKSTGFYEPYKSYNSIEDFPVINKIVIRDNYEDFLSKEFINFPKFKVSTSGSTGTPFTAFQNKNKRIRNLSDTIYFSEKAGFKILINLTYF